MRPIFTPTDRLVSMVGTSDEELGWVIERCKTAVLVANRAGMPEVASMVQKALSHSEKAMAALVRAKGAIR